MYTSFTARAGFSDLGTVGAGGWVALLGAVLRAVGCVAAPLLSTHQMSVVPSPCPSCDSQMLPKCSLGVRIIPV